MVLLDEDRRDDADLRGAVLQAPTLNGLVPGTVDASVDDDWSGDGGASAKTANSAMKSPRV